MADNLSITIGADSAKLRADLALAQSELRAFTREMNAAANTARRSGSELALSQTAQAAAQVNRLTAEVARLKTEMGEASAAVRGMERIGEGAEKALTAVTSMKGAFREMGEAVGLYLVAEHLKDWALEAGEAAERTQNLAAAVGISAARYSELQAAMQLAGGNPDTMARALVTVQQRAEEALRTGSGRAYNAFRALGLSPDDMKAGADQLMGALREAWDQMGPGSGRTAAFAGIFGRRELAEIVPLLNKNKAEFDALVQKGRDFNLALSEGSLGTLSQIAEKTHELEGAFQGLKNTISETFSGPIISEMEKMTQAVQGWVDMLKVVHAGQAKPSDWASTAENIIMPFLGAGPRDPELANAPGAPQRESPMHYFRRLSGRLLVPGGALQGEQPEFADRLQAMIDDAKAQGVTIGVVSGHRSEARQAQLYEEALAKYGSPAIARLHVAPPGHSMHNLGLAADLAQNPEGLAFAHANAARYGLTFPMSYEPWHIEPVGARQGSFGEGQSADWGAANKAMLAKFDEDIAAARQRASAGDRAAIGEVQRLEAEKLRYLAMGLEERDNYLREHAPQQTAELLKANASAQREVNSLNLQYYDADTRNLVASLQERQAAAQDYATKIALQQQIVETLSARQGGRPEGPGIGDRAVQDAQRQLTALQREASVQRFQLAEQDAAAQRQSDNQTLAGFRAVQEIKLALHQQTAREGIGAEITLAQQLYEQERTSLSALKDMAKASGNVAEQAKVERQERSLSYEWLTKILDLQKKLADDAKKTAEAWAQPFRQAVSSIGSDMEKTITDLVLNRGTSKDIWKNAYQSAVGGAINLGGSLLSKAGGYLLGDRTGKGLTDVLGDKLMGLFTNGPQVSLQVTANALLAEIAANTAISASTSGVSGAGSLLSGGGGLLSFLGGASSVGSAAASGAGSGFLSGISSFFSTAVPSAAGGWALPSFAGATPALLHSREMVLPAHISEGIQNMIGNGGGGDTHLHFHGPADGPAIERFMTPIIRRAIPGGIRQAFTSGALTPRTV